VVIRRNSRYVTKEVQCGFLGNSAVQHFSRNDTKKRKEEDMTLRKEEYVKETQLKSDLNT
jgi:hypothetical protein